jgi:hypothetical protein
MAPKTGKSEKKTDVAEKKTETVETVEKKIETAEKKTSSDSPRSAGSFLEEEDNIEEAQDVENNDDVVENDDDDHESENDDAENDAGKNDDAEGDGEKKKFKSRRVRVVEVFKKPLYGSGYFVYVGIVKDSDGNTVAIKLSIHPRKDKDEKEEGELPYGVISKIIDEVLSLQFGKRSHFNVFRSESGKITRTNLILSNTLRNPEIMSVCETIRDILLDENSVQYDGEIRDSFFADREKLNERYENQAPSAKEKNARGGNNEYHNRGGNNEYRKENNFQNGKRKDQNPYRKEKDQNGKQKDHNAPATRFSPASSSSSVYTMNISAQVPVYRVGKKGVIKFENNVVPDTKFVVSKSSVEDGIPSMTIRFEDPKQAPLQLIYVLGTGWEVRCEYNNRVIFHN